MRKLGKKGFAIENSIEAFACTCECGCSCGCGCMCDTTARQQTDGNNTKTYGSNQQSSLASSYKSSQFFK